MKLNCIEESKACYTHDVVKILHGSLMYYLDMTL